MFRKTKKPPTKVSIIHKSCRFEEAYMEVGMTEASYGAPRVSLRPINDQRKILLDPHVIPHLVPVLQELYDEFLRNGGEDDE